MKCTYTNYRPPRILKDMKRYPGVLFHVIGDGYTFPNCTLATKTNYFFSLDGILYAKYYRSWEHSSYNYTPEKRIINDHVRIELG